MTNRAKASYNVGYFYTCVCWSEAILISYAKSVKSDIITVNETWLNTDTGISIPGYSVFHKELQNQVIGAGISTLVSTRIQSSIIITYNQETLAHRIMELPSPETPILCLVCTGIYIISNNKRGDECSMGGGRVFQGDGSSRGDECSRGMSVLGDGCLGGWSSCYLAHTVKILPPGNTGSFFLTNYYSSHSEILLANDIFNSLVQYQRSLLCGDLNARHIATGSSKTNSKSYQLIQECLDRNLIIHNSGMNTRTNQYNSFDETLDYVIYTLDLTDYIPQSNMEII